MHIFLIIWGMHPKLITGTGLGHPAQGIFKLLDMDLDPLFLATHLTSVISASKGIADFLMNGPCKLVPNEGLCGGMGRMGYILLCLNIGLTLWGKGILIRMAHKFDGMTIIPIFNAGIYWMFLNAFPQLLLVRTNFYILVPNNIS